MAPLARATLASPRGGSMLQAVSLGDGSVATWRIPPLMACHAMQAWTDDAGVETVVDARTMQPLAELFAPHVLPFGFHAAFVATH